MKNYITRANVLGLGRNEIFSSDDEFYTKIAESGIIEEMTEDAVQGVPSNQHSSVAEGAGERLGEGGATGSAEGGGKGEGTLPK